MRTARAILLLDARAARADDGIPEHSSLLAYVRRDDPVKRRVLLTLGLLAGVYLALCLIMVLTQDRLVYFPTRGPSATPAEVGLAFEERRLTSADGVRLHAFWIPRPESHGALLFCHGNGGDIGHRMGSAAVFAALGWSSFYFDYRGYGASEGRPSEEGTYLDAVAAYDELVGPLGIAPRRIVAVGESLGAAVAIELALRRPLRALLLESAFTSLAGVGATHYPWLPVRLLARYRYANAAKIAGVGVPLFLMHSPDDEIVPFAHAERLFAVAREPKELLRTAGRHNDGGFLQRAEWIACVGAFLDRVVAGE
jgi:fermentation-respiration switch protein FrsA (DUF1100 family)